MIPPIPPISTAGLGSITAPTAASPASPGAGSGAGSFASLLGNAIDQANVTQQNATTLAMQGATGQANVADVTVAATEAQLSLQLITSVRDKAVAAFTSIMSMTG